MRHFTLIWIGDLASQLGSSLTGFALAVHVYQSTGSVTRFAFVALLVTIPGLVLSPLAGAATDRWGRRTVMMASNAAGAACTVLVAIAAAAGELRLWQVYGATAAIATVAAFHAPAYAAAVAVLVPGRHLGRANGLIHLSQAGAQMAAPLLAAFLVSRFGIQMVLFTDAATYVVALIALAIARMPAPALSAPTGSASLLFRGAFEGFAYHRRHPGLLALLIFFAAMNLVAALTSVLVVPLVLKFSSIEALGTVLGAAGFGMLIGSLVMVVWGGPRRRARGVVLFGLLTAASVIVAGLRPSVPLIAVAMFAFLFVSPFVNGCSLAIWQTVVPADLHGRVFAARRVIARSSTPVAYLAAGPLADRVFDPLLLAGGPLSGTLGQVLGTGPGRGIGLLFIVMGCAAAGATAAAWAHRGLRALDDPAEGHAAQAADRIASPVSAPHGLSIAARR